MPELTPRQIVAHLDNYIIGQSRAKKAVAIALRNRYRRMLLPDHIRDDVTPKNILMIGPTGVGKTEVARRLAKLANAPFVKVEATRFTEVGYVGRDADSMIRDLVETAIRMVKQQKTEEVRDEAVSLAQNELVDRLCPVPERTGGTKHPLEALFGQQTGGSAEDDTEFARRVRAAEQKRGRIRFELLSGMLEDTMVEIEVEGGFNPTVEIFDGMNVHEMGINFQQMLGGIMPKRQKTRRMTVAEARDVLVLQHASRLIDEDSVIEQALKTVEQRGIVFIDEIDKVAGRGNTTGPDVSREGVQRDILPIVEGSTVMTKHGPVLTNHILFIAAGAFHVSKPSDLIPELQGRFPIRVEFDSLDEDDFRRILTEPKNSLTLQYMALLKTDGVSIRFSDDALDAIAQTASTVNDTTENIGARRLHTVLERVLEEISYEAPDVEATDIVIDGEYVRNRLADVLNTKDLSKYIL